MHLRWPGDLWFLEPRLIVQLAMRHIVVSGLIQILSCTGSSFHRDPSQGVTLGCGGYELVDQCDGPMPATVLTLPAIGASVVVVNQPELLAAFTHQFQCKGRAIACAQSATCAQLRLDDHLAPKAGRQLQWREGVAHCDPPAEQCARQFWQQMGQRFEKTRHLPKLQSRSRSTSAPEPEVPALASPGWPVGQCAIVHTRRP